MDHEAPEGQWDRTVDLIDRTPNLIWQLLTKRPHYYLRNIPEKGFINDNVWLGTSAENQEFYDVRWPKLQEAATELVSRNQANREGPVSEVITFISYEPALGPITLRNFKYKPHWIIFGGESGNVRRPMEQSWAENIKAECEEFGVAFFMKQMSAFTPSQAAALIPAHLMVREFPGSV